MQWPGATVSPPFNICPSLQESVYCARMPTKRSVIQWKSAAFSPGICSGMRFKKRVDNIHVSMIRSVVKGRGVAGASGCLGVCTRCEKASVAARWPLYTASCNGVVP